jgi:hypothetical protein
MTNDVQRTAKRSHVHLGTHALHASLTLSSVMLMLFAACGDDSASTDDSLHAVIGVKGGELIGGTGTPFAGVKLTIPADALTKDTTIEIVQATDLKPLPSTAVSCGPLFNLRPAGLKLAKAATLTLPFSEDTIDQQERFDDEVKVWVLGDDGAWGQTLQTDSQTGSVTVEVSALTGAGAGVNPPKTGDVVHFDFAPNAKFLPCFAQYPDDTDKAPMVSADVVRGDQNDGLFLHGSNIKPGLAFDMFTVEHSSLQADGSADPMFKNFGLAWYQSDLEASDKGDLRVSIRTILLDQIFGFDPEVSLTPTQTLHVGFWFNDPNDAAACGFDVTKPTPFNGEHMAGPLAMITLPDADTGLGPLCTNPDTSQTPARCSP